MVSDNNVPGVGLLAVDLQPGFLKMLPDRERFLRRCAFAIEATRLFGMDVWLTEQAPEKLGGTDESIRALAPEAPVFTKRGFSAFQAEGLVDRLRDNHLDHLLVIGLETSICVYQTVMDALAEEFAVTVLTDAVSGRRAEDSAHIIQFLHLRTNAHLLPSEAVFYSILGSADDDRFKPYTQLVQQYADPT